MNSVVISIGGFIALAVAYLYISKKQSDVPQTGGGLVGNEIAKAVIATPIKPVEKLLRVEGAVFTGTDLRFLSNTREKCFEECLADDRCAGMTLYTHPSAPGCGLVSDIGGMSNLSSPMSFREGIVKQSYLDNSKFINMQNMGFSSHNATWLPDMDNSACESNCLSNPDCEAYMIETTNGNTKGCSLKHKFDLAGDLSGAGAGRNTLVGVKTDVLRKLVNFMG